MAHCHTQLRLQSKLKLYQDGHGHTNVHIFDLKNIYGFIPPLIIYIHIIQVSNMYTEHTHATIKASTRKERPRAQSFTIFSLISPKSSRTPTITPDISRSTEPPYPLTAPSGLSWTVWKRKSAKLGPLSVVTTERVRRERMGRGWVGIVLSEDGGMVNGIDDNAMDTGEGWQRETEHRENG